MKVNVNCNLPCEGLFNGIASVEAIKVTSNTIR